MVCDIFVRKRTESFFWPQLLRIVAADLSARNCIGYGRMAAWRPPCKALIVGINYTGREVALEVSPVESPGR